MGNTLVKTTGVWKGNKEAGIQVVIVLDDAVSPFKIMELARQIKIVNNQEAVLVTEEPVNGLLIWIELVLVMFSLPYACVMVIKQSLRPS